MAFRALGICQRVFSVKGTEYEKAQWLVLRYSAQGKAGGVWGLSRASGEKWAGHVEPCRALLRGLLLVLEGSYVRWLLPLTLELWLQLNSCAATCLIQTTENCRTSLETQGNNYFKRHF